MAEDQLFEALCPQPGSTLQCINGRGAMAKLTKDRLPKMIVTDQLEDRRNSYILGHLVIKMHL